MSFVQIMIFFLSAASIWFVSRREKWKRWGFIIGLVSQPFWLYETYMSEQWGMFAVSVFYTYSWCQGIYNYWIKEEKA